MCIFSLPVRHVSRTRIFARLSPPSASSQRSPAEQYLVYSMTYAAESDLAMILPLPVAQPALEKSLRFINLKPYPNFFDDMDRGFPSPVQDGRGLPGMGGFGGGLPSRTIEVHQVGDFVASFVPTLRDFARLDPRFTLPAPVWDQIPAYRDFGFAVFQLKPNVRKTDVHPMAFAFNTRWQDTLFLPTLHIHDGQIHRAERFDHSLYVQDYRLRPTSRENPSGYPVNVSPERALQASTAVLKNFVDVTRAGGIIEPNEIAFRRTLRRVFLNQDTLIPCGA